MKYKRITIWKYRVVVDFVAVFGFGYWYNVYTTRDTDTIQHNIMLPFVVIRWEYPPYNP